MGQFFEGDRQASDNHFGVFMDPGRRLLRASSCACSQPRVIAARPTVYLSAAHATYATYAISSRLLNP